MLEELGIGFVPFSPLGKGFLTGTITTAADVAGKTTAIFPRFNDNTLTQHQHLVTKVSEIADRHHCSPGQVALAWIISTRPDACPIPFREGLGVGDAFGECLGVPAASPMA